MKSYVEVLNFQIYLTQLINLSTFRSSLVSRSSSYEGEGVYVNGDEIDV